MAVQHISGQDVNPLVGRARAVTLLLWLVLITAIVSIVQVILLPLVRLADPKLNVYHRMNAFIIYWSCLPFFNVTVKGVEHFPKDRNVVLVCNHQSALDAFVFAALAVHHDFKCTFKEEILWYPGVGWMLWLSGHIPVRRGNKKSGKKVIATAAEYVKGGVPVLFFPEATRRVDVSTGPLTNFKPGAFKTAIDSDADILPITMSGARSLLPPFGFPSLGYGDVEITVHAPLSTRGMRSRDDEGNFTDSVDRLLQESWNVIVGGLRPVDHVVVGSDSSRAKASPGVQKPTPLAERATPSPAEAASPKSGGARQRTARRKED